MKKTGRETREGTQTALSGAEAALNKPPFCPVKGECWPKESPPLWNFYLLCLLFKLLLRIILPMQETRVQFLVQEDTTCLRTTKP